MSGDGNFKFCTCKIFKRLSSDIACSVPSPISSCDMPAFCNNFICLESNKASSCNGSSSGKAESISAKSRMDGKSSFCILFKASRSAVYFPSFGFILKSSERRFVASSAASSTLSLKILKGSNVPLYVLSGASVTKVIIPFRASISVTQCVRSPLGSIINP